MRRTTGKTPALLSEQPEQPEELGYLWHWFTEVKTVEPLTYQELAAWSDLTRKALRPWEVELLRSIDRILRETYDG